MTTTTAAAKRRKPQQTTTAKLSDNVILEILKRLPLKYAVQCSVLNKNIHRRIFEPNILPSYRTIFYCNRYGPNISFTKFFERIMSTTSNTENVCLRSETLNVDVSIIVSCNGLLLLHFKNPSSYYIFNPTTSAVMPIDRIFIEYRAAVGLAVPDNSRFKLVTAKKGYTSSDNTCLKIRVIAPSLTDSGELASVLKTRYFDFDRHFDLIDETDIEPVYAHGILYWLGDGGRVTVAFDVEKDEARLIDGPVEGTAEVCRFGFAVSSMHLVYMNSLEIVVCSHDHCTGEWGVKRSFPIKSDPTNTVARGWPVFFLGRQLLFLEQQHGGEDLVFRRLDVEKGVEQKIGREVIGREMDPTRLIFFSYTSSVVKVSDLYLGGSLWKYGEDVRRVLLKLQELLRPTDEIFSA